MTRSTRGIVTGLVGAALLAACAGEEAPTAPTAAPAASTTAADPVAPTQPPPAAPAAAPPPYLAAGVHQHQIQIDSQSRHWTTVVPARPDGVVPSAVVVVLHGVGGRGTDMRSAGFEALAASSGVVLAYPDAFGGAWNDGRPGADPVTTGGAVDDVRFLRLVIEETAARTGADARRVAVVGYSNGAVMAGKVACELAERVSAVALVAGSAGQGFEQSCHPTRPLAVMLVAGSNDRTVPYGGGRVADWGTRKRGFVAPVDDFFAFWRGQSGCSSTHPLSGPPQVSAARGGDCRADTTVVRYRVNGGGHEWFRAPQFDTTSAIWEFVSRRFAAA